MDLCWQSMSLLFNKQSMCVIAFLGRSKCILISWVQSASIVILKPKKIKSLIVSIVSHLFAKKWWDQMPWSLFFECWLLSSFFTLLFHQKALYFLFTFCHKGKKKKVHSFFNQSKFLSDFKEIIAWNKIVVLNYRGSGSEMCTPDLTAQHTKSKKKKVRNFPYSDFKHPLF